MTRKLKLKTRTHIITAILILIIAGLLYFTWRKYQWLHPPYSPEINSVLFMADDNRTELEKVLKHYSRDPADSLKLRAAEFLIVNMPGKYSLEYDAPFEDVMAVYMRWDDHEDWSEVEKIFGVGKNKLKEDVKYITAEYLINNIELSFKVWGEQPWGKNVPFDVFCEEILPYRVANEPLENWREKILESFSRQYRSFKENSEKTAVDACIVINNQLPRIKLMGRMPDMNYSMIMTTTRGMCTEMSALAVFAMRALGIPVAQENTPKWPGKNTGHTWNSVYDSAGRRFSFMGAEAVPGVPHIGSRMSKSKVYRQTYAIQNNIDIDIADIPPAMRNQCVKDVTEEYINAFVGTDRRKGKRVASDFLPIRRKSVVLDYHYIRNNGIVLDPLTEKEVGVEIPVKYPPDNNTGYAWLSIVGDKTWNITGWGTTDAKTIRFGTVGRNILYLPLFYRNGTQTVASYPFMVDNDDSIRIFEPDTANLWQLSVTNILPAEDSYSERMINGVIEGANRSDFSDATVLYTIKNANGAHFSTAKIRNTGRFRYVRYVSPEKSHCNVAEIVFYNDKGEKLGGKPIGTPGSNNNSNRTFDKALDGNISTFYDAMLPNDSWMGLDLGEAQTVSEVHYLPRNNGNGIYEGHTYELYCWSDTNWQFFNRQTVPLNLPLYFRIPTNALLYLKNTTTGKLGRWFTVNRNGKQEWI
ncbi:MAG: discoidin domain-containing protein [Tannerella sp.]|jgi:hypothetical protein|nr:discoidin domain-containing protein [Tannerella sp.]